MQYVTFGKSGLKVSRLCLGMMTYGAKSWREWVLTEDEGRPFVKHALEQGITFFDTADIYSLGVSEEILGRAMKDYARREHVVIATKCFNPMGKGPNDKGLSRKHIMDAIDGSLRRLGMDYVDLYIIHRWDYDTPIEETMEALTDVVKAGKARYIGASSMFAYQLSKSFRVCEQHGWVKFSSMQNHYNLVYREEEREIIPLCKEEGLAITPWSPLARGFLTGSRKRGSKESTLREKDDSYAHDMYYAESDYQIADRVVELAKKRGVPPAQVALAWMLGKEYITAPIIGASKMHHLDDAIASLEIKLTSEEVTSLEELYVPHKILGHS